MACLNAAWEGLPSPNTPHTLESVSYVYGIPSGTEFPVRFAELWLLLNIKIKLHNLKACFCQQNVTLHEEQPRSSGAT